MKEIIIYGAQECGACLQAKSFLKQAEMPFTYINVGVDMTPDEFFKKTGSQSVPVIIIDGEKHIGWNPMLFN